MSLENYETRDSGEVIPAGLVSESSQPPKKSPVVLVFSLDMDGSVLHGNYLRAREDRRRYPNESNQSLSEAGLLGRFNGGLYDYILEQIETHQGQDDTIEKLVLMSGSNRQDKSCDDANRQQNRGSISSFLALRYLEQVLQLLKGRKLGAVASSQRKPILEHILINRFIRKKANEVKASYEIKHPEFTDETYETHLKMGPQIPLPDFSETECDEFGGKYASSLSSIPTVELDRFLLADVYADQEPGTAFVSAENELIQNDAKGDTYSHAVYGFDDSKILLLYAQMQKLSIEHPNKRIEYHFTDDRVDILARLYLFFEANKSLIPNNLTLHISLYQGYYPVNVLPFKSEYERAIGSAKIEGLGRPNPNYGAWVRYLYVVSLAGTQDPGWNLSFEDLNRGSNIYQIYSGMPFMHSAALCETVCRLCEWSQSGTIEDTLLPVGLITSFDPSSSKRKADETLASSLVVPPRLEGEFDFSVEDEGGDEDVAAAPVRAPLDNLVPSLTAEQFKKALGLASFPADGFESLNGVNTKIREFSEQVSVMKAGSKGRLAAEALLREIPTLLEQSQGRTVEERHRYVSDSLATVFKQAAQVLKNEGAATTLLAGLAAALDILLTCLTFGTYYMMGKRGFFGAYNRVSSKEMKQCVAIHEAVKSVIGNHAPPSPG